MHFSIPADGNLDKQLGARLRSFELAGELEKGWLIAEATDEMLSERRC